MGEHIARATPTKKKSSNIFWNIVGVIGELLITFAFVIGLFSVWQVYSPNHPGARPGHARAPAAPRAWPRERSTAGVPGPTRCCARGPAVPCVGGPAHARNSGFSCG